MISSAFPPHVPLDPIVVSEGVVECRAYDTTCWATAGGNTTKEAYGKIVAFAHAIGLEPPVPSLTRLAVVNDDVDAAAVVGRVDRPVRVFAYVDPSNPLVRFATVPFVALVSDVGVFFEPRRIAFVMPFDGDKLVGDDEVRRRTAIFRRAVSRSGVVGLDERDVLFASYDTSVGRKFSRRNEVVLYL